MEVDAVFAGHNHFYARMVPQDGIRYFVSGGGGRKTYGFESQAGYIAAGGDYYHFVLATVTPTAFTYRAIDSAGAVRSTVKARTVGRPATPRASSARTENVCAPSPSPS